MAKPLDTFLSRLLRRNVSPTETVGVPGTAVFGGFIQSDEKNANLSSLDERHKTYSEILANASIVAAGTRYFLNLISKAEWSFVPSEADTDGKFAELAEEVLTSDPATPWHRIIRRAAMYRFYGFSVQEWTARRRDDGVLTFADVAPRAQLTIERWDLDVTGGVLGVLQRSPQDSRDIYLPRSKLLYIVDDTLSDSPEGLGLFRHLVAPAQRLFRYEQLEGFGFETDLRGIPIGRGPFTELASMVEAGEITQDQRTLIEAPLRSFIENHIKTSKLGMLLDSIVYESKDETGRPSPNKQWDVEIMKGSATSFQENAAAIERLNRELARILGVEQLMLGSDQGGSFALSKDKTSSFFLLVDGALTDVREAVAADLLDKAWELNGWPEEMKPTLATEAVRHTDAEGIAGTLRDVALAGAPLAPDDPVVGDIRDLLGVSRPVEINRLDEDEALIGSEAEEGTISPGETQNTGD
ncbi:MAG: hypothetical protein V3S55_15525 [Nitrospiraceae bacterium]